MTTGSTSVPPRRSSASPTRPATLLADEFAAELTVEEAAGVVAGFDMWSNHRVDRLGLGAIKVTDGPVGARGEGEIGAGTPSLVLPCPTALAATWDPDLVEAGGAALAAEVRDRSASVLLAPTVNLHRTPLAGRNFECFGEDPHLTARMAVAYISGVQGAGVSACVKHFVANDQEHERHSVSAEVSERALRELYLVPFEAAVREAGVWMVMSAYNRLWGTWCGEHPWLLTGVLRDEWGFDGAVVSDWLGTHSTVAAALAGLDWEMPGRPTHFGPKLAAAVEQGEVPESTVRQMARNVLGVAERTGGLDGVSPGVRRTLAPERSVDRPDADDLARRIAAASIVLLANRPVDGTPVLPLDPVPARVAVIGPSADEAWIQGGGSAQLNARHAVTPLEGLRQRLGADAEITFSPAVLSVGSMPLADGRRLVPLAPDAPGVAERSTGPGDTFCVLAEYFDSPDLDAEPVAVVPMRAATAMWAGRRPPGITAGWWSRWRATVEVPDDLAAGSSLRFGISSSGPSRLLVDGVVVCDATEGRLPGEAFFGLGCAEVTGDVPVTAGQRLAVTYEVSDDGMVGLGAGRFGVGVVPPADGVDQAVAAAAAADVAIVVIGLDHDTETEGRDRTTLALRPEQDDLVAAVAAVQPRTVVVVNAGAPVLMPWRNDVAAVVQLWYPGQEGGHALADVLSGDVNPSGRLPTTFPDALADSPPHADADPAHYPGVDGKVHYAEDLLIGYRWFDAKGLEPQWCFGHGLSYAGFAWSSAEVRVLDGLVAGPVPGDELPQGEPVAAVTVEVANTSARDGHEVVQVYVTQPDAPGRPGRQLAGFARVAVPAGATVPVTVRLPRRAFAAWDDVQRAWVVRPGRYEVALGASSRDLRHALVVDVAPAP